MPEDTPLGLGHVQEHLPEIIDEIAGLGAHATPCIVGRYDHAEAAIISIAQYWALSEQLDDLIAEPDTRARLDAAPPTDELEFHSAEDLETLILPNHEQGHDA